MEQTETSRSQDQQALYPDGLRDQEEAFIQQRRSKVSQWPKGVDPKRPQRLGLALSGGGIRSATFCLGALQGMARNKMLRCVDILSTVSGGGYTGGFLGGLFVRHGDLAKANHTRDICDDVEEWLKGEDNGRVLHWLRENGRYLAPDGVGDLLKVMAVQVCQWVSIMFLMGLTILSLFTLLNALRVGVTGIDGVADVLGRLTRPPAEVSPWFYWLRFQSPPEPQFWWWSPYWIPAVVCILLVVILGAAMLMIPKGEYKRHWLPGLAMVLPSSIFLYFFHEPCAYTFILATVALVSFLSLLTYGVVAGIQTLRRRDITESEEQGSLRQNIRCALEKPLMLSFKLAGVLIGLALLDSLGQSIYLSGQRYGLSLTVKGVVSATGLGLLLSLGDRLGRWLESVQKKGKRFSAPALCGVVGFAGVGVFVLNLNILSHMILWRGTTPGTPEAVMLWRDSLLTGGFMLLVAYVWGQRMGFLNRTSLQEMYGLRLTRAYLGGSNPKRVYEGHAVTSTIQGDDLWLDTYQPHEQGGPLHLINTTLNEKFSARTQTQHKDRLGMSFTVGPAGLSVAPKHHAPWAKPFGKMICVVKGHHSNEQPIQTGFAMFPLAGCHKREEEPGTQDDPPSFDFVREVENLSVGHWLAISGAAFGTGMGSHTRLGLSLLAGLANIRLGYWWDSHVKPQQRKGFDARNPLTRWLTWAFPVQSYLLDEWFAKFQGPAQRCWYLSDGGHFENTGVYELLRRRVAHIVCCDCGEDHEYTFADIANLVRKARIDLQADIKFVPPAWLKDQNLGVPAEFFGMPETVTQQAPEFKGGKSPHAMLAVARYVDSDPTENEPDRIRVSFSVIVFLKPTFSGDEPLDLVQYRAENKEFPQETTGDQFFNEAQWESYRKLGEHVATKALGDEDQIAWLLKLSGPEAWKAACQV